MIQHDINFPVVLGTTLLRPDLRASAAISRLVPQLAPTALRHSGEARSDGRLLSPPGSATIHLPSPVRARIVMISRYVIFACALGWLGSAYAQEPHRDIPSNAHTSADKQGWACNEGFTQVSGLCMEDSETLPSQGAFEFFDGQWRCRSGYHRAGRFCVPGVAPEHAAFVGGGEHWECDWGFQKTGSQCQEIKPPPHGYLDASGHDWVCYPGFARVSDHCVPMPNTAPTQKGPAEADSRL